MPLHASSLQWQLTMAVPHLVRPLLQLAETLPLGQSLRVVSIRTLRMGPFGEILAVPWQSPGSTAVAQPIPDSGRLRTNCSGQPNGARGQSF